MTNKVRGGERLFTNWRIGLILIFVVSIVLYIPSLSGLAIWDDHQILTGQSIGGGTIEGAFSQPFNHAYFRPLTSLSYLIDLTLFEEHPFFYHQTNILIHAATAVLVAWLGLLLFKSRRVGLLAGLLFAVQPAQCSAVSWIGARTDLLGAFFGTLFAAGLFMYLESNRARWLVLSSVSFFLGMLAKEQLATLIVVPPVAALWLWKRNGREAGAITAVYATALAGFAALWLVFYPEPYPVGWAGFTEQLRRIGMTAFHYAQLLVVPTPSGLHSLSLANYDSLIGVVLGYGTIAFVAYTLLLISRRSRETAFATAVLAFAYLPISNTVPIPSLLVGPYRAAVAGIMVAILGAWCFQSLSRSKPLLGHAIASLYVVICAGFCLWNIRSYSSEEAFFGAISKYDPNCLVNRINYANLLLDQGDVKRATVEVEDALNYVYGNTTWKNGTNGLSLYREHPEIEARVQKNQGTSIKEKSPLPTLFYTLAIARDMEHQQKSALNFVNIAVALEPKNPSFRTLRGQIAEDEQPGSGLNDLRLAVKLGPNNFAAWAALGSQRLKAGDYPEADTCLTKATQLNPSNGNIALDLVSARIARRDEDGTFAALKLAEAAPHDSERLAKSRAEAEKIFGRPSSQ